MQKPDCFLRTPHIPETDVSVCAVSAQAPSAALAALEEKGIRLLRVSPSDSLLDICASHPDMRICHLGEDHIAVDPSAVKEQAFLEQAGLNVIRVRQQPKAPYPKDIALNCLFMGNCLFGKLENLCSEIKKYAADRKQTLVSVRQGYSKCAVCVLSERAAITSDPGLFQALSANGVEVLKIRSGSIFLKGAGEDGGMIGGCCGLIAPGCLAVCGDLRTHPDFHAMADFLRRHQIRIQMLLPGKLIDVGGILPLLEAVEE